MELTVPKSVDTRETPYLSAVLEIPTGEAESSLAFADKTGVANPGKLKIGTITSAKCVIKAETTMDISGQ
jgi:hypothetical protein